MSKRDQFEAIKPRNLPKIDAAKHKVGVLKTKVNGAARKWIGNSTMLILVLNLPTRIKLGRHTWCARYAPRLCVGGPMAIGV